MADEHRALAHVSERRQSTPTGRVLPPMRKARLYAIATTSVLRKSSVFEAEKLTNTDSVPRSTSQE